MILKFWTITKPGHKILTREQVLERALIQAVKERDEAVEALHRLANEMLADKLGAGVTTHHAPAQS